MRKTIHFCSCLMAAFVILLISQSVQAQTEIRIGVLALQDKPTCKAMWDPTAQYLKERIPGYTFEIIPLFSGEMFVAVADEELNFIVCPSIMGETLKATCDIEPVAIPLKLRLEQVYPLSGGVIFCLANSVYRTLDDLEGKRFMAVTPDSFDGWIMAWREMADNGFDPTTFFSSLTFAGRPQNVVYAVRDGTVEAGTVGAGILEGMAHDMKIDLRFFRIMPGPNSTFQGGSNCPFLVSTRLYPDYTLARLKKTPSNLVEQVVGALLKMSSLDHAVHTAHIAGWTLPQGYSDLHDCMVTLGLGPYSARAAFKKTLIQFRPWLISGAAIIVLLFIISIYVSVLNRRLAFSQARLRRELELRKKLEEERQHLEGRIRQAQKLESLGVMAGGLSHDLNNTLMVIVGGADHILSQAPENSPVRESMQDVIQSARRAAELCKQVQAYSGKEKISTVPMDITGVIHDAAHLFEGSCSKRIVIHHHIAAKLPAIHADGAQLQQMLMSIFANAEEAIGGRDGAITLSTGTQHADAAYLNETYMPDQVPEGEYVFIQITDTGCGMDKEVKARVFDPFFTTKPGRRGMGLAVVLGIIRGHKGTIKVDSEPGKGTTMKILFPVVADTEQPSQDAAVGSWKGSGAFMLVEEEEAVRRAVSRMLTRAGFTVIAASSRREAIDLLKAHPGPVAGILLDMTMHGLHSEDIFNELRKLRADIPILLSSGYSEYEVVSRMAERERLEFIQKPYEYQALVRKLKELLSKTK